MNELLQFKDFSTETNALEEQRNYVKKTPQWRLF